MSFLRRILPRPLLERLDDVRYRGLPHPIRVARPHSMLSNVNLFFLQELARRVEREGVAGDFVECGVYRGGSAAILGAEALASRFARALHLYDAFAGMPAASAQDDDYSHTIEGKFVGSEAQTRRVLQRAGVPENRYEIVVGWFEETLPGVNAPPVALLHVDCDFYEPVKLVLEKFYPHVLPGGYVVLNDYGSFQGCRKATDEFLSGLGDETRLVQIDQDAYYFQKPGTVVEEGRAAPDAARPGETARTSQPGK